MSSIARELVVLVVATVLAMSAMVVIKPALLNHIMIVKSRKRCRVLWGKSLTRNEIEEFTKLIYQLTDQGKLRPKDLPEFDHAQASEMLDEAIGNDILERIIDVEESIWRTESIFGDSYNILKDDSAKSISLWESGVAVETSCAGYLIEYPQIRACRLVLKGVVEIVYVEHGSAHGERYTLGRKAEEFVDRLSHILSLHSIE